MQDIGDTGIFISELTQCVGARRIPTCIPAYVVGNKYVILISSDTVCMYISKYLPT
jgi:hypothetical protein